MNRPIKFRAWDKYNKSMIKPCLTEWIDFEGNCYFEPAKKYNTPNTEIYPTDDYILMQFTGLHDKNGKEIYEGDIVKWERDDLTQGGDNIIHSYGIGFIEWNETFAMFSFAKVGKYGCFQMEDNEYEVIGNIYENPDLIPEE